MVTTGKSIQFVASVSISFRTIDPMIYEKAKEGPSKELTKIVVKCPKKTGNVPVLYVLETSQPCTLSNQVMIVSLSARGRSHSS